MPINVLALCGSNRRDSLNQKLLKVVAQGARDAGANITFASLRDYPLPIYDGDAEAQSGLPGEARALQTLIGTHDALLIASPEHNGSCTALLKNALDWASRPTSMGESGLQLFSLKAVAIVSASPGPLGGARSALALRGVLDKLGALVIPQGFSLGLAHLAFAGDGNLTDPKAHSEARAVGSALMQMATRLSH